MDQLFKRYADPFSFIDCMLETNRFLEFVLEILNIENEETVWEFFLHKVYDKSFDEFKQSLEGTKPVQKEQIETTVKDSKSILTGFIPNGGE